jgi:hemerythrin superfamily protein
MTTPRSSSTATASQKKTATPDALALLKSDHRAVADLFEEHDKARKPERKQSLVARICEELTVHAELEEKVFYPAVQAALPDQDRDLVAEARVEHASLKWLIAQLQKESPESELYEAKVTVLHEYVDHHVKEEEKEMFPKVRKTDLDLDELGLTMAQNKEQLQQKIAAH